MLNRKFFAQSATAGILFVTIFSAGILTATLTGCTTASKVEANTINQTSQTTIESTVKPTEKNDTEKIMNDFKALSTGNSLLPEVIKFLDKNISLVSKEDAAVMVIGFEEMQKKYSPKLEEKFFSESIQTKIAKVFLSGFDIEKVYSIEDSEVKPLITETKDSGFKVETAEGTFFPVIDYEFYKKFSTYVTEDIKEYIDIMSVESNKVAIKDAAIIISWDDIIKRALNQEKFINQYSNSTKLQEVKNLFKRYLTFTLFGANNTPLFDYEAKIMVPDAKKAYASATSSSNNSKYLKLVSDYLSLLEKNNYKLTDEVDMYRKSIADFK